MATTRQASSDDGGLIARRAAAIDRLQHVRVAVRAALNGLGGLAAFRGSEWSVADVLVHLKPGGHVAELRAARIPGCVSEAGPSVLAFETDERPTITVELLGVSNAWRILRPRVRRTGFELAR